MIPCVPEESEGRGACAGGLCILHGLWSSDGCGHCCAQHSRGESMTYEAPACKSTAVGLESQSRCSTCWTCQKPVTNHCSLWSHQGLAGYMKPSCITCATIMRTASCLTGCRPAVIITVNLETLWRLQGVIVAAPVYAATGSRWKALGISIASVSTLHDEMWKYCQSTSSLQA